MKVRGKLVWENLKEQQVTILAANTRSELMIEPIMAAVEELDSIVAIELAKTECFDPCFTGIKPDELSELAEKYAAKVGDPAYFMHEDHNTFGGDGGTREEMRNSEEFRDMGLESGYSSFSVDASYLPLEENIEATVELSGPIVEAGYGLEVEVGEIKKEEISKVGESAYFAQRLVEQGIQPQLLAINNGSKHGHYGDEEWPHINLRRTYDIARTIKHYGFSGIAQHGTSGTDKQILHQFPEHEIKKANVATEFQDVLVQNLPGSLQKEMSSWSEENGKPVKYSHKEFREKIMNVGRKSKKKVFQDTFEKTKQFIRAFNAEGLRRQLKRATTE